MGAYNRYRRRAIADWASFNVLTDVPSLKAWYRADTTTNAGGFVSQLTDKSGNGFHFVQGTGSKQPALIASGSDPNGKDCVVFDGTDDALTLASPGFGAMNDVTWIGVTRSVVTPAASGTLFRQGNFGNAKAIQLTMNTNSILSCSYVNPASTNSARNVDFSGVAARTVPTVVCVRHNSSAATSAIPLTRSRLGAVVFANSVSNATVSTIAAIGAAFGAATAGTTTYLGYGLYEWIVCNALLTDDQVRKIELYLAGYYGLL